MLRPIATLAQRATVLRPIVLSRYTLVARRFFTADATNDAAAAAAAVAAASAASASSPSTAIIGTNAAPPRPVRRSKTWASDSQMLMLEQRGFEKPRGRRGKAKKKEEGAGVASSSQPEGAWPRGVPKPKPKLPTPPALANIDRPWMQSQLTLEFDAPAFSSSNATADAALARSFRLQIAQWTGMEEIGWQPPRRRRPRKRPAAAAAAAASSSVASAIDVSEPSNVHPPIDVQTKEQVEEKEGEEQGVEEDEPWVEAPTLTPEQQAAEDEARAQADAGSGSIVWDAALHLAHYLHRQPIPPRGPVLELGAGTGALGLAVAAMLRNVAPSSQKEEDSAVVLTENGKVLELLRHNAQANDSHALVRPLDWSDAGLSSFLTNAELPPYYSTILCSELIDALPSAANAHSGFQSDSLRALVHTLTRIARHSSEAKRAAGANGGVDVLFTFEQRGLLSLGPAGLLDQGLLQPLRDAGFDVQQITNEAPYADHSALCLFRLHMD